ncbi:DUF3081 family protein [Neptunicella marina]|uniref:DUF3081 family protein n=1 Tax=Neptunicella marina TaxID=2125989 RepID=A0A8J6M0R3_9ALTE|nr:DUF3081 family protein [Neptunicella marina]MBC3767630.1 DUF3081 family protein [Neptunicella marina]
MQNELDTKQALKVFNLVCEKGEKRDEHYFYQGLEAWHDFDGYTCYLKFNQATLTLYFHGKYNLDYADNGELESLFKKIANVAKG